MAHALARLRSRRNALLPISLLPEILETVFMFLRGAWPMRDRDLGWLKVTQVCSAWRDIAIHYAPLWTRLSLGVHEVGLWDLFLKRAGSVALRDYIWPRSWHAAGVDRYTPLSFIEFRDLMMGDLQLVRTLHIEDTLTDLMFWPDEDDEDGGHIIPSLLNEFLRTLTRTVPRLKSLTLLLSKHQRLTDIPGGGFDNVLFTYPAHILSHYTPNMERVVLRGLPYAWTAAGVLPQLRALTLLPYSGQVEQELAYTFGDVTRFSTLR